MSDPKLELFAQRIVRSSFDSLDVERVAAHRAAFQIHDEDLCSRKYVFKDGSFITVRNGDYVATDPASADSLLQYANWIGVASSTEVATVSLLLNMIEPGSMLVH